jgi:Ca2+-binding EF-hand superfamily protein
MMSSQNTENTDTDTGTPVTVTATDDDATTSFIQQGRDRAPTETRRPQHSSSSSSSSSSTTDRLSLSDRKKQSQPTATTTPGGGGGGGGGARPHHRRGISEVGVRAGRVETIAEYRSPERRMWREHFNKIDANGDERVSLEEIIDFCNSLSRGLYSIERLSDFMSAADTDNDGELTFDEFLCAMMDPTNPFNDQAFVHAYEAEYSSSSDEEEETAEQIFNQLDRDGDGFITLDDFVALERFKSNKRNSVFNEPVVRMLIEELMQELAAKQAHSGSDGVLLNYDQFKDAIRNIDRSASSESSGSDSDSESSSDDDDGAGAGAGADAGAGDGDGAGIGAAKRQTSRGRLHRSGSKYGALLRASSTRNRAATMALSYGRSRGGHGGRGGRGGGASQTQSQSGSGSGLTVGSSTRRHDDESKGSSFDAIDESSMNSTSTTGNNTSTSTSTTLMSCHHLKMTDVSAATISEQLGGHLPDWNHLLADVSDPDTKSRIRIIFDMLDLNGDGRLEIRDLRRKKPRFLRLKSLEQIDVETSVDIIDPSTDSVSISDASASVSASASASASVSASASIGSSADVMQQFKSSASARYNKWVESLAMAMAASQSLSGDPDDDDADDDDDDASSSHSQSQSLDFDDFLQVVDSLQLTNREVIETCDLAIWNNRFPNSVQDANASQPQELSDIISLMRHSVIQITSQSKSHSYGHGHGHGHSRGRRSSSLTPEHRSAEFSNFFQVTTTIADEALQRVKDLTKLCDQLHDRYSTKQSAVMTLERANHMLLAKLEAASTSTSTGTGTGTGTDTEVKTEYAATKRVKELEDEVAQLRIRLKESDIRGESFMKTLEEQQRMLQTEQIRVSEMTDQLEKLRCKPTKVKVREMTARERNKEFFFLTSLVVKLNIERVLRERGQTPAKPISTKGLYEKAMRERVNFANYHSWLTNQLSHSLMLAQQAQQAAQQAQHKPETSSSK